MWRWRLNRQEAENWFGHLLTEGGSDAVVDILMEWYKIKMTAERKLSIPTGENDWVGRFLSKIEDLQDANAERIVFTRKVETALLEMQQRLGWKPCRNCKGTGQVGDRTCVCCDGFKKFKV